MKETIEKSIAPPEASGNKKKRAGIEVDCLAAAILEIKDQYNELTQEQVMGIAGRIDDFFDDTEKLIHFARDLSMVETYQEVREFDPDLPVSLFWVAVGAMVEYLESSHE